MVAKAKNTNKTKEIVTPEARAIGIRLKALMKARKPITNDDVGKLIGKSGSVIGNYRAGRKLIKIQEFGEIAKELNASLDWLVLGRGMAPATNGSPTPKEMLHTLMLEAFERSDKEIVVISGAVTSLLATLHPKNAEYPVFQTHDTDTPPTD